MNPQELVDRFCESRRRWLIVTGVTLVVALVTVLPQVDQYLALRADEHEKEEELAEAGRTAEELPAFRARVAQTEQELAALEERTLPADRVAQFRSELVELVRESRCQVKRIVPGAVRSRKWKENDWPLADAKAKAGEPTPFRLETRPVSLTVTGSMSEVRNLLGRIENNGMMMHAKTVDLRPSGRGGDIVQLELELWCFALVRGQA